MDYESIMSILEEYDITNEDELSDALYEYSYFHEDLGATFSDIEDGIHMSYMLEDFSYEEKENVVEALLCYDSLQSYEIDDYTQVDKILDEYYTYKYYDVPLPTPQKESSLDPSFVWFLIGWGITLIFVLFFWFGRRWGK